MSFSLMLLNSTSSSKLEQIGDALVNAAGDATKAGSDVILRIVNNTVVPIMLLVLFVLMLYFIAAIAYAKKKRDGEGSAKEITGLAICFVVFLIIGAYSVIFGGLINVILGKG